MPEVKGGKGKKAKHFGYDDAGIADAQAYAEKTGGTVSKMPPKAKKGRRGRKK